MTLGDEIDLTKVPPAKLAKNAVLILAVQQFKKLLTDHPELVEMLDFHYRFYSVLGHRRLGRTYLALAQSKDPLAELHVIPEEKENKHD